MKKGAAMRKIGIIIIIAIMRIRRRKILISALSIKFKIFFILITN